MVIRKPKNSILGFYRSFEIASSIDDFSSLVAIWMNIFRYKRAVQQTTLTCSCTMLTTLDAKIIIFNFWNLRKKEDTHQIRWSQRVWKKNQKEPNEIEFNRIIWSQTRPAQIIWKESNGTCLQNHLQIPSKVFHLMASKVFSKNFFHLRKV